MSDETGSSQTAGRPAGRGRRPPRRGGRGYRGRGRRPAAPTPNVAPSPAEGPPGEELIDQPQPGAEEIPAAMHEEPEAVGEGSTQQDVRDEIAGAELEPPPREEREPSRAARPQRPPQPPPQRFQ